MTKLERVTFIILLITIVNLLVNLIFFTKIQSNYTTINNTLEHWELVE